MKKVLLYSGGMDSWLIDKLWKPDEKIYIDLGTSYAEFEMNHLPSDVRVVRNVLHLTKYELGNRIIPTRNLYFAMVACNEYPSDDLEICLGTLAGDNSIDKTYVYAALSSGILTYLYSKSPWLANGRRVNLVLPYKEYIKSRLLKEYLDNGGDIEEAFTGSLSCYNLFPNGDPCWHCRACARKYAAFKANGYVFSPDITARVSKHIRENLIPEIQKGYYDQEAEDLIRAIE